SPEIAAPISFPVSQARSAWLFHIDARHVLACDWQPLHEDGKLVGVRAKVVEQEGRSGTIKLRGFRSFESARKIDGRGQTIEPCSVERDTIAMRVCPFEFVELEARFAAR
ncbi:MAG: hypothetical protein KDB23_24935, partial [Planctomycetales bacterium]|nr:hypothetical protein [Planctomycetales bacterium]